MRIGTDFLEDSLAISTKHFNVHIFDQIISYLEIYPKNAKGYMFEDVHSNSVYVSFIYRENREL